jgi:hypothetical protein
VGAFEREGQAAEAAPEEVVEAATKEARVADAAVVVAAWELVGGDDTEVEDGGDDEQEVVEDGEERCAGQEALHADEREVAEAARAAVTLEECRRARRPSWRPRRALQLSSPRHRWSGPPTR